MSGRAMTVLAFGMALSGCSRGSTEPRSTSTGAPTTAQSPAAANGTLALGEPVTSRLIALAEIAQNPARYRNQLVATSGIVTAVCQQMGCWMEINDESTQAHIKMHGHSFFVPKTAAGHFARVQAKVLSGYDESCEDSPPPKHVASAPKVELDATGVELD